MSTIKTVGGWKDFFSNPWKALSMKQGMGILHIIFATAILVFASTLFWDKESVIYKDDSLVENILGYIFIAVVFFGIAYIVIGKGIEMIQVKLFNQPFVNETDAVSTSFASPIAFILFFFILPTEKETTILVTSGITALLCVGYWLAKRKGIIK